MWAIRSRVISSVQSECISGAAIQIQSFLSAQKDAGVDAAYQPDHIIRELPELVDYLEERNRAERLTMQ